MNNNNGVLLFFIGAAAGMAGLYLLNKKTADRKLKTETEKAKESGYIEAHENFKKVLNHVHMRGGTPSDVFDIITS